MFLTQDLQIVPLHSLNPVDVLKMQEKSVGEKKKKVTKLETRKQIKSIQK